MTYQHAEAFCLMTYRADDGSDEEIVWNSRDGVTPFVITLRSGKQATHVDWRSDRREPDFQPPAGMRIFVDLTPEVAWERAEALTRRIWGDPDAAAASIRLRYENNAEEFTQSLVDNWLGDPGTPMLVEVTA